MGRLFSLFQTVSTVFLSVGNFLTNEGAKSMGLHRLRQFGGQKKKRRVKSPFEDPFTKKKFKRGFLDGAPREPRIKGHSLSGGAFGSGWGNPSLDPSNPDTASAYRDSIVAEHKSAMVGGFANPQYGNKSQSKKQAKLRRGQESTFGPRVRGKVEHKGLSKPLTRGGLFQSGPGSQGSGGGARPNHNAGRRTGNGPGGIGHRSVRNHIKF